MKLLFVVMNDTNSDPVIQTLLEAGCQVTRVASTGGFLRRGSLTLLVGVEDERVEPVLALLRAASPPAEEGQHRATIFVVDMPYFEQI